MLWLPPAYSHSFLTSRRGQQHIHEPEHKRKANKVRYPASPFTQLCAGRSCVVKEKISPRFGVQIIEYLCQQVPVDSSIQTVLQKHTLVTIARWDHAAIHEVELDELSVGQVQVHCHKLTATTLCTHI